MSSFPKPGQLNVQPTGLLDFLKAKTGGQYPQRLGDVLQPVWDLAQHYFFTQDAWARNDFFSVNGTNLVLSTDARASFWRRFSAYSIVWFPLNALDSLVGQLVTVDSQGVLDSPVFEDAPATHSSAAVLTNRVEFSVSSALQRRLISFGNFWVPPDHELAILVQAAVVTAPNTTLLQVSRRWSDLRG